MSQAPALEPTMLAVADMTKNIDVAFSHVFAP